MQSQQVTDLLLLVNQSSQRSAFHLNRCLRFHFFLAISFLSFVYSTELRAGARESVPFRWKPRAGQGDGLVIKRLHALPEDPSVAPGGTRKSHTTGYPDL